jgi:hypothetical protein
MRQTQHDLQRGTPATCPASTGRTHSTGEWPREKGRVGYLLFDAGIRVPQRDGPCLKVQAHTQSDRLPQTHTTRLRRRRKR